MPELAPHGGSWLRDPKTGELALAEQTMTDASVPVQDVVAAPVVDTVPADKKSKNADASSATQSDGGNSQ